MNFDEYVVKELSLPKKPIRPTYLTSAEMQNPNAIRAYAEILDAYQKELDEYSKRKKEFAERSGDLEKKFAGDVMVYLGLNVHPNAYQIYKYAKEMVDFDSSSCAYSRREMFAKIYELLEKFCLIFQIGFAKK
ncbi:MAG TPA: hypothetical protein PLA71_00970 [Saccharofermentans sp.]|nr:hypothetical protein [Saccharofermentans sp.]